MRISFWLLFLFVILCSFFLDPLHALLHFLFDDLLQVILLLDCGRLRIEFTRPIFKLRRFAVDDFVPAKQIWVSLLAEAFNMFFDLPLELMVQFLALFVIHL